MTSSLVGSEMCIRDSNKAQRHGEGREFTRQCGKGRKFTRPYGKGRKSTPVSYTHLTLPTICSV
eukprot:5316091-Prorocentrum_lima.AAC.1